jgi:hypothetical protein
MPITSLPVPPSRDDPSNFSSRADAFLSALPTFANEANGLQSDVNSKQTTASTAATSAIAAQAAAEAASNASIWVSGTTYAVGNVRFSPNTFRSYRRKTAGAGTTDPASDPTNWQLLTSLGDVDTNSTQTLTNKTHSTGSVWNGTAVPVANGGTGSTSGAGAITNLLPSMDGTMVGSLSFMRNTGTSIGIGAIAPASSLQFASIDSTGAVIGDTFTLPSGTWRCISRAMANGAGLFVRTT